MWTLVIAKPTEFTYKAMETKWERKGVLLVQYSFRACTVLVCLLWGLNDPLEKSGHICDLWAYLYDMPAVGKAPGP